MKPIKFGGLDIAQRVDNTCVQTITLLDGKLEQTGGKLWPHIDFGIIAEDILKINRVERYNRVHYDQTGQGELARKVFSPEIPLFGVLMSAPKKFDIITKILAFFHQDKLKINDKALEEEILEQEKVLSDAGNQLYRHPEGFHDDRFWSFGLAVDAAATHMLSIMRPAIGVSRRPKSLDEEIEYMLENF